MLSKLKAFFESELSISQAQKPSDNLETKLQKTCAILLLEISKADYAQSSDEMTKIRALLKNQFSLQEQDLDDLVALSQSEADDLTSMYPLTSLINEHYEYSDKLTLMHMMWKVAYADGNLSKYEDHVIRHVAELLYVSHSDFIQSKHSAASGDKGSG